MLLDFILVGCCARSSNTNPTGPFTLRLGYFPTLTHAVALVGVARGTFKDALGPNVHLATKTFNAGPALIEALFASDIDIGYIGPNPAIHGYIKSNGAEHHLTTRASTRCGLSVR